MRTTTTAQKAVLSGQQRSSWAKVEVFSAVTSTWINLASLFGLDFVQSVEIDDDLNQNGATATVILNRNQYFYNLSPLVQNQAIYATYGNLVDINRPIRISLACTPVSTVPTSADWNICFYGRIYQTDFGPQQYKLTCQDWIGQLNTYWIQNNLTLATTTAQANMQALLTLGSPELVLGTLYSINGTTGTPFNAGDSPGWNNSVAQTTMSMYTALSNISQQIGWLLRQKWNNSVGNYVLTWYNPTRTSTTSLFTFGASNYFDITQCGLDLTTIRNVIDILWQDSTNNLQLTTTRFPNSSSPAYFYPTNNSVTAYGTQYMKIAQEATSQLTLLTQVQLMGNACLQDLGQPVLTQVVSMPLFWPTEVGDLYTFNANGYHYSTNQLLAVQSYKHTVAQGKAGVTELTVQGNITGGTSSWFSRQWFNVQRQFGASNANLSNQQSGNLHPNGNLGQYSNF